MPKKRIIIFYQVALKQDKQPPHLSPINFLKTPWVEFIDFSSSSSFPFSGRCKCIHVTLSVVENKLQYEHRIKRFVLACNASIYSRCFSPNRLLRKSCTRHLRITSSMYSLHSMHCLCALSVGTYVLLDSNLALQCLLIFVLS